MYIWVRATVDCDDEAAFDAAVPETFRPTVELWSATFRRPLLTSGRFWAQWTIGSREGFRAGQTETRSSGGVREPRGRAGRLVGRHGLARRRRNEEGPARHAGHHRLLRRARGRLELSHRRLPGLPQMAQGPQGPRAFGQRDRSLTEDRRRALGDDSPHGGNRRRHRRARWLAKRFPIKGWGQRAASGGKALNSLDPMSTRHSKPAPRDESGSR